MNSSLISLVGALIAILVPLVLLVYAWVLYPLLVLLAARGRRGENEGGDDTPPVAVLLSAHNEEKTIRQRIQNLLSLDYPANRLHVYVGLDGCTDSTAELVARAAQGHTNIGIVAEPKQRGKAAMLRALAKKANADLLAFTDANTMFDRNSVQVLVRRFADRKVGGVCGRLVFVEESGTETDENFYWRLESRLKAAESALDSCLGANGAIYAIRRELFWKGVPDNTIIDDFVIGMKIREQGFRMVYEPDAVAREELPGRVSDEIRRRVRIGAGDYQALWLCRRCLAPRFGWFAWSFWSHKALRWLTPHLAIVLLGVSMYEAVTLGLRYPVSGLAQTVFCTSLAVVGFAAFFAVLALLGAMTRGSKARWSKAPRLCHYFLTIQAALFLGFLRFCRGNLTGAWERTAR